MADYAAVLNTLKVIIALTEIVKLSTSKYQMYCSDWILDPVV